LWDTPGLGEGSFGNVTPRAAQHALRSLLRELNKEGGVHLLVVCMRGIARITRGMRQTYDAVLRIRDQVSPQIPVVAVITELEKRCDEANVVSSMEEWWTSNESVLAAFGMSFCGHACLTTLPDDCHPQMPGRHAECQRLARNLLIDYSLPFSPRGESMRMTNTSLSLKLTRNIVVRLVRDLIIDHALTPRSVPAQDLHVILFGESGVGKSSLVNLLAGWHVAEVSPDSVACTLTATEYQFQLGATTIRLWDTVGLEEPESGTSGYVGAIERATELVQSLSASGGISLFLFCVRGNRVTTTMQSNYRLFYEVLGNKKVPIALAVTHLERERVMEGWWERNARTLEQSGIRVGGHACITTLEGHAKYLESREAVQELLWQYAEQGKFSMPSETWLGRLLSGLSALLGLGFPKGKDLVRFLTKRCHLEPDVAQRVAACIEATTDM
ncbi:P-loop containing nucleoside triphosphate hydrolase protein, partial [Boletus coccyginus]